jgi:hypothetical protein
MTLAQRTTEAEALALGADYALCTAVDVTYVRRGRMVNADYAVFEVVATSDQFMRYEERILSVDDEQLVYIDVTTPDTER